MTADLTKGLIDYLTPQAAEARSHLIAMGADPDLALAILEVKMPDTWIYEIPDESRHERITRYAE